MNPPSKDIVGRLREAGLLHAALVVTLGTDVPSDEGFLSRSRPRA